MRNAEVAELLREMADFLEMQDVEYKPRAYRRAARNIAELSDPIADVAERGELQEIDGVGEAIAAKVEEFLATGHIAEHDELKEAVPVDVEALTAVEGLGPKRVRKLYQALDIRDLDDLEEAAEAGEVAEVEGFGAKSQQNILDHIALARRGQERTLLGDAEPLAHDLVARLEEGGAFDRLEVAGSFRRRRPTVGDLDVLAVAEPGAAMDAFTGLDDVDEVLSRGDTKASVVLSGGLRVDLRVVEPGEWGAALHYFTGSKDHNVALRRRAQQRGYKLNEYGLFEDGEEGGERVAGATEAEVYDALDLPFIPPELREATGELEAAEEGELPDLLERDAVRGDLQMHTEWSDGSATVREMAEAAQELDHDYILVTDHGPHLPVVDGLQDLEDVEEQRAEIAEVDDDLDIAVLQGMEADVTADGLDVTREMAEAVDLVVASVHRAPADPTAAVVAALEDWPVAVLGHPTNRKLLERDPIDLDLERVVDAAAANAVALEINAQPRRLDLDWRHVKEFRDRVDYVISTDAHSPAELGFMHLGVDQARRGWLEAGDVLNTRPLDDLLDAIG